jgi:ABC-2 type transport system ATP-binding protein
VIRAKGVSKSFRRVPVLAELDLEIAAGERVALIGANGAGKTTLIRCLLGEYECAGDISLAGGSPRLNRTRVLRRVGFVPQLPPPLRMPVERLVRFAARACNCDPHAITTLAGRLGLDVADVAGRPFQKLSGGQKQQLLIALALRPEAEVLILDEPAANLDREARRSFFELLAEREPAPCMLISVHRLEEVVRLVDRVIELDRGQIDRDERVSDRDVGNAARAPSV